MLSSLASLLCAVLPCELAGQWYLQTQQVLAPSAPDPQSSLELLSNTAFHLPGVHRVAIIGAGAGGSSAAFWISKAQERNNLSISVDIYEAADYIGGRSTVVYPYDSKNNSAVELGASIFVKANKNMMRAAKEFNLTLNKFDDDDNEVGIWDGERFYVKMGGNWLASWWNKLQIVWRYGMSSPSRTESLVNAMIKSFLNLYTSDTPKWDNLQEMVDALDFSSVVNQTASDYLSSHGVHSNWINEVVEATTRVNYGQNVDSIHGMGGLVSMAANGAFGVQGGNFQIFQQFIKFSSAKLHLKTKVAQLERISSQWLIDTPEGVKIYDSVILAAPLTPDLRVVPRPNVPQIEYVNLHVTILTTTSPILNATYFGQESHPPTMVLTTFEGARKGGKEPPFTSISYHGRIAEGKDEWVVKIFSKAKPTKKWLNKVFNNRVGWVYHKVWKAYPVLTPGLTFSQTELLDGLYYINAFEPFISTMETETVAARNAVDLLLHRTFNSSICGESKSVGYQRDFVYGWDC